MGTTITAAIVNAEREEVGIGHVGDSRAYRMRGGKLEQLTRDHSLVEEMRRKGQLTDAQAEDHPQRSIITRALGPEPEVEVDVQTVPALAGDVFLICSDGLTTMLGEEQIADLLSGATLDGGGGAGAGRRSEPGRRARQHHRARLPARGRRRASALARGPDSDRRQRRGGGADRDRGSPPRRRRGRPQAPRGAGGEAARRGLKRAAAALARARSCIGGIAFGAWYGNRQVWFLGTDGGGRVALYRGLPYELPFGIDLYQQRYCEPDPDRDPAGAAPGGGHRPRPALPLGRGLPGRRHRREPGDPGDRPRPGTASSAALVPVALLLTAGFAAVFAQEEAQLGNLSLIYGAYFLAICLAAHIFLRIRLPDADPYLFPLVALLTAFGLVMIYRIDDGLARDQANWFVFGLVLFALTIQFLRDYDVLERYRYTIAAAGLLLLLAPRLPGIGQQVNGAYLGVKIGPLAFQPAEFSKICIVVFLASYLREHREVLIVGARRILGVTLPPLKHLGPLLVVWGASMFMLVFIRDLGSSLMFFAAFLALLYVATGRFSFVVIGMTMFVLGAWFFASTVPHVGDRVDVWLDPYQHPQEQGYQILQSIFAQADGGLFGQGFAQGLIVIPGTHPPQALLPAAQTDTIYALIVNELGLFGAAGLILVYLLVAARGFKIALLADDGFSKLLATGLTAVFAIQAFVIVGGVTRVIPLTGVTLPFVSYGGSSVVANFVLLALLLLISDRARREARGLETSR